MSANLAATAGSLARRGRKTLAGLPGLSAPVDLIAARHCIDLLATGLKEAPADPRRSIWLAEALLQTQRDLRAWAGVRTVINPSSIITRTAIRQVAALGDESGEDAAVRLLRRAFSLSQSRVRQDHVDAVALHVLARVYLARGMAQESLRLARLAWAIEHDERADVLVTAARAMHKLRLRDEAARTAERAVEEGSTLGYEVLAQLLVTDTSDLKRDPTARVTRFRELRRKVRPEDRARYSGATRSPAEVARAVKSTQWQKAGTAFADATTLAARAREAIKKGDTT